MSLTQHRKVEMFLKMFRGYSNHFVEMIIECSIEHKDL